MKICLVNSFFEPDILGGAEISVKILAQNLIKKNIDVSIICSGEEDKVECLDGIRIYRVKVNNLYTPKKYIENNNSISKLNKILYKSIEINNVFNKKKLKSILEKEAPDIVHVNNIYGISSVIWTVAHEINIPIIQTLRDYFIMCPKSTLIKSDNKKCTKVNNYCYIYRKIYKYMSKKIDYITAPSQHTLNKFIDEKYFVNIKSKCVYNAIDFDKDKIYKLYSEKINKNRKIIRFIYLGALVEHKGVKELIGAFNKISENADIELHIAGKGDLEEYVKNFSKINKKIIYHGFLKGRDLEELLYKVDILIAPSKWEEPFGRIVLDAYKNAMPVIVSKNGGLKEIVQDKITGVVLDKVDEYEISNAINFFLENSNSIDNMLKETIKYLNEFSIDSQTNEFIKIYKQVIKEINQ